MSQNLLLLHGALGSKKQLEHLKSLLQDQFNVWSMNFEGHGGDLSQYPFSMELFVENVETFMRENSILSTHIFGFSMGGYVALTLANKQPQLMESIVTLGTKFNWTPESAAAEVKMLNPDVIEQKVPHFAEKLKQEHQPADWKSVMQRTANMMLELADGKGLKTNDLANIKLPVTIGIGDQDRMVSIEESESAANKLANAKLKILEGVKHPLEKVDLEILVKYISSSIEDHLN